MGTLGRKAHAALPRAGSSSPESCDVHRVFDVTITAGVPEVTMLQPLERPLEYRPPLKLALVESHGTEATIAVMGAPAGADIFPAAPPAADAPERDANLGA